MLANPATVAGMKRPVPMPAMTAKATVAAKLSTSAMPMNASSRTTSAATAHQRRDHLSAMAPKTGPSSIAGSRSAPRMMLMAHGDS